MSWTNGRGQLCTHHTACFDSNCSLDICEWSVSAALLGEGLALNWERHQVSPEPNANLQLQSPASEQVFVCTISLGTICESPESGSASSRVYVQGRCLGLFKATSAEQVHWQETCHSQGGQQAALHRFYERQLVLQRNVFRSLQHPVVALGMYAAAAHGGGTDTYYLDGARFPSAVDQRVLLTSTAACGYMKLVDGRVMSGPCSGVTTQVLCEWVGIPTFAFHRRLGEQDQSLFLTTARFQTSVYAAAQGSFFAWEAYQRCTFSMGGGHAATVSTLSSALALRSHLLSKGLWQVGGSSGSSPSHFHRFWMGYFNREQSTDASSYLDPWGRPPSPPLLPSSTVSWGWPWMPLTFGGQPAGVAVPDQLNITDVMSGIAIRPGPTLSKQPIVCESPLVPRCPEGWLLLPEHEFPRVIVAHCFRYVSLQRGTDAPEACQAAHPSAYLLVIDSQRELDILTDDSEQPAILREYTWTGIARADVDDTQYIDVYGRKHGPAAFLPNEPHGEWEGGTPNATDGEMCTVLGKNFALLPMDCNATAHLVCEMPTSVPGPPNVASHAAILARPLAEPQLSPDTLHEITPGSWYCPRGRRFVQSSVLGTCIKVKPVESWLSAQQACSAEPGARLAAMTTPQAIRTLLGILAFKMSASQPSWIVSAFISLGDWGSEGEFHTLDGRPVDLSSLGIPVDDFYQDDEHDCVVLQIVLRRQRQLKIVKCSDLSVRYAICEAPMFRHGHSEYFMLPAPVTAKEGEHACAQQGGYLAVPQTPYIGEMTTILSMLDAYGASLPVLTGLRHDAGDEYRTSRASATTSEVPLSGLPSSNVSGTIVFVGNNVNEFRVESQSAKTRHPAVCERDMRKVCPPGWLYGQHFCWQTRLLQGGNGTSLGEMLGQCAAAGGTLASPSSQAQWDFLVSRMAPLGENTSLGLTLRSGQVHWADSNVWRPNSTVLNMSVAPQVSSQHTALGYLSRPQPLGSQLRWAITPTTREQLHISAFICQRPAYLSTFVSCPQGWIPMFDRCILHSLQNISWPWAGAAVPMQATAEQVPGICSALGGSSALIPDSDVVNSALQTYLGAQTAFDAWHTSLKVSPTNRSLTSPLHPGALCSNVAANNPGHTVWTSLCTEINSTKLIELSAVSPALIGVHFKPLATGRDGARVSLRPAVAGKRPFVCELRLSAEHFAPLANACASGWRLFGGECYSISDVPVALDFWGAEMLCVSKGATLAALRSEQQLEYLQLLHSESNHAGRAEWLGASLWNLNRIGGDIISLPPAMLAALPPLPTSGNQYFIKWWPDSQQVEQASSASAFQSGLCVAPAGEWRLHAGCITGGGRSLLRGRCLHTPPLHAKLQNARSTAMQMNITLWAPTAAIDNQWAQLPGAQLPADGQWLGVSNELQGGRQGITTFAHDDGTVRRMVDPYRGVSLAVVPGPQVLTRSASGIEPVSLQHATNMTRRIAGVRLAVPVCPNHTVYTMGGCYVFQNRTTRAGSWAAVCSTAVDGGCLAAPSEPHEVAFMYSLAKAGFFSEHVLLGWNMSVTASGFLLTASMTPSGAASLHIDRRQNGEADAQYKNYFMPGYPQASAGACVFMAQNGSGLFNAPCSGNTTYAGICQAPAWAPIRKTLGHGLAGSTWGIPAVPTALPVLSQLSSSPTPSSSPTASMSPLATVSTSASQSASSSPSVSLSSTALPSPSGNSTGTAAAAPSVGTTPSVSASSTPAVTGTATPSAPPTATPLPALSAGTSGMPLQPGLAQPGIRSALFRTSPPPVLRVHIDEDRPYTVSLPVRFAAVGHGTGARIMVQPVAAAHVTAAGGVLTSSSRMSSKEAFDAILASSTSFETSPGPALSPLPSGQSSLQTLQTQLWQEATLLLEAQVAVNEATQGQRSRDLTGVFAYNISVVDDAGVVAATQPLVLVVTAASASISPARLTAQAAPDAGRTFMQLQARVKAEYGDTHMALRIPQSAACWLSLPTFPFLGSLSSVPPRLAAVVAAGSVDAPDQIGDRMIHVSIQAGETVNLPFVVDLSVLPRGLHAAEVTLYVGDAAGTQVHLPVSVLVASVVPCPARVALPPMMLQGASGASEQSLSSLSLRNLASSRQQVVAVVILPQHHAVDLSQAGTCAQSTASNMSHNSVLQFSSFQAEAAQGEAENVNSWLRVSPPSAAVQPGEQVQLPSAALIGSDTTPQPGQYNATVVVLVRNMDTGAHELAVLTVYMTLLQGPVQWKQSSIEPLYTEILGQHVPLLADGVGGISISRAAMTGPVLVGGRVLLALVVLRDALGRAQEVGRNALGVTVWAAPPSRLQLTSSRQLHSASPRVTGMGLGGLPLPAGLVPAWPAATDGLMQVTGLSSRTRALLQSNGAFMLLVKPSDVLRVPPGLPLHVEVTASLVAGGGTGQQAARPVSVQRTLGITVTRATCGYGQMPMAAGCACAAGFARQQAESVAAVPTGGGSSALNTLTSVTLECVPCAAGTYGKQPTLDDADTACQVCGPNSFSVPGSPACAACPLGATCARGKLTVLDGYGYSPAGTDKLATHIVANSTAADIGRSILLCPNAFACVQGDASVEMSHSVVLSQCTAGHRGQLCAMCEDGFTYSPPAGGATVSCARCNSANAAQIPWAVSLAGVLLLGALMLTWTQVQHTQPSIVTMSSGSQGQVSSNRRTVVKDPLALAIREQPVLHPCLVDCDPRLSSAPLPAGHLSRVVLSPANTAQLRFIALLALALHLLWSSQLDSYRSNSQEATTSLSILSHMGSIFPVQAWHTACLIGNDSFLTWSLIMGAVLPAAGALSAVVVAAAVRYLPCCACNSDKPPAFRTSLFAGCGFVLLLTVPRSVLSMFSVFATVLAAPGDARVIGDFTVRAGSSEHIVLQAAASAVAATWLSCVVLCLLSYSRVKHGLTQLRLASAEPPAQCLPGGGEARDAVTSKPGYDDSDLTNVAYSTSINPGRINSGEAHTNVPSDTVVPHNQMTKAGHARVHRAAVSKQSRKICYSALSVWTALGWAWGFFSPHHWWYATVWLAQGGALATVALWPGSAVGRSYFSMLIGMIFAGVHLWVKPLTLPRDAPWLQPYTRFSAGHLQRLHVVASASNALFTAVQIGVAVQAGFSYLYETALVGSVFSGAGPSNPFSDDIAVHLPSAQNLAASALNLGFFVPLWLLLACICAPSATTRGLLWLGLVAGRPCLARCMRPARAKRELDPDSPNTPQRPVNPMFALKAHPQEHITRLHALRGFNASTRALVSPAAAAAVRSPPQSRVEFGRSNSRGSRSARHRRRSGKARAQCASPTPSLALGGALRRVHSQHQRQVAATGASTGGKGGRPLRLSRQGKNSTNGQTVATAAAVGRSPSASKPRYSLGAAAGALGSRQSQAGRARRRRASGITRGAIE